jgi:lipopolysaccharide/colanic/teichoic acid biosynthesis glycosyltransferase
MTAHYPDIAKSVNVLEPGHYIDRPGRRTGFYRSFAKRGLDIGLICLTLPFSLPLILLMALLVSLDGGKPFYSQQRIGRHGRVFTMWKLRSMVQHADSHLQHYLAGNPAARAEWETSQKLKDDPRITRLGRLLRKSSIDELPQLVNVLRGDMSLVGPRPMMPEQQALYPGHAYYLLRPGITGFWQISDRNQSSFAARAEFDAQYEGELSLKADLKVLMATVMVVARCTGY